MKLRRFLILMLAFGGIAMARGDEIVTLIRAYDAAWDRGDVQAMYDMLDPECVFKSPFQMRIGRDDIQAHLFQNTKRFRDTVSVEEISKIDGDIAYSWGYLTFNDYAPNGTVKSKRLAKRLYIFTRHPGQGWKFRFLIITEESHVKSEAEEKSKSE